MKTIKLDGPVLDLVKDLTNLLDEGQKRLKQLEEDRAAVEATIQKETDAKTTKILETVGVDPTKYNGSVDGTYLKDHGVAFIQLEERRSFFDILEDVLAGAVAQAQEKAQ